MTRKPLSFRPRLETLDDRSLPSFLAPVNYAIGSQQAVAVGDFNNDNHPDIVTIEVGDWGSSSLTLLLASANRQGQFKGQFQSIRLGQVGVGNGALAVGDFNNDKNLDIISTGTQMDASAPGSVGVLLGNGNGTFQAFPYGAYVGFNPESVAVGDFNGDGKLDAVTVCAGSWYVGRAGETDVLLGDGGGGFTVRNIGTGGGSVAVADFNGDGKLDIVKANSIDSTVGGLSVLLGNGDGTFAATYNAGSYAQSVKVGDFNADGKIDFIATTNNATNGNLTNSISVLLNNGGGAFRAGATYAAPNAVTTVAVADFNGDGKLDLASVSGQSTYVMLGNGDGTFGIAQNVGPGGSVAVGDFNGDGFSDLTLAGSYGVDVLFNAADWSGSGHHKK